MMDYTTLLSPIYEVSHDYNGFGPSVKCRDCGKHFNWTRINLHVCEKQLETKFNFDLKPIQKSAQKQAYQPKPKPKPKILDVSRIQEYQKREIEVLRKKSETPKPPANIFKQQYHQELLQSIPKEEREKISQSQNDRKYSLPLQQTPKPPVVNRSQSLPENDKIRQAILRRREKSLQHHKNLIQNLMQDIEELMKTFESEPKPKERSKPASTKSLKKRKSIFHHPKKEEKEKLIKPCFQCGDSIDLRKERHLEAVQRIYHIECFQCQVCGKHIGADHPFWQDIGRTRADGRYEEGLIMCEEDYQWLLKRESVMI